jgi:hypothetical protein
VELETACRRHLLNQNPVKNLVVRNVWKWFVQRVDDDGQLTGLEGTGEAGIVIRRVAGWTKPIFKSSEFPILVIDCLSDDSRFPDGRTQKYDAADRAMAVWREVDRVLHQGDGEHRYWPENDPDNGLYVEGCIRGSDPAGPVLRDGIQLVRCTYDVKVFH